MVTKKEIQDIARLSHLFVPPDDLDALTQDMNRILTFAETIDRADDSIPSNDALLSRPADDMREDAVTPSLPADEVLQNAGGGEDGFFVVETSRVEGGGV